MKKKMLPFGLALILPLAAAMFLTIGCSDDDEGTLGVNNGGTKTITATVRSSGDLTVLETALDSANLGTTLESTGPYTLLAPSDSAFKRFDSATIKRLLADSAGTLTNLLRNHVVAGNLSSSQLAARDSVTAVSGKVIHISVRNGVIFLNDSVKVTVTNIKATNGTIHIIDKVLVP